MRGGRFVRRGHSRLWVPLMGSGRAARGAGNGIPQSILDCPGIPTPTYLWMAEDIESEGFPNGQELNVANYAGWVDRIAGNTATAVTAGFGPRWVTASNDGGDSLHADRGQVYFNGPNLGTYANPGQFGTLGTNISLGSANPNTVMVIGHVISEGSLLGDGNAVANNSHMVLVLDSPLTPTLNFPALKAGAIAIQTYNDTGYGDPYGAHMVMGIARGGPDNGATDSGSAMMNNICCSYQDGPFSNNVTLTRLGRSRTADATTPYAEWFCDEIIIWEGDALTRLKMLRVFEEYVAVKYGTAPYANIKNLGFELPVTGSFTAGSAREWVTSSAGSTGVFRPVLPGPQYTTIPEGAQVGYGLSGHGFNQNIGMLIRSDRTYTFDIWGGSRADVGGGSFSMAIHELDAGGALVTTPQTIPVQDGQFHLRQASWASGPSSIHEGKVLQVRLRATSGASQINWDLASITET